MVATTLAIVIKISTGMGNTTPTSLDEKILKEKIEERAGKDTVKSIRKNRRESTVTMKLEGDKEDKKLQKFIDELPMRKPVTLHPGHTLVINRTERKNSKKFTILAPYYNEKSSNELITKLEDENAIKIHKTKRLGKSNVHLIELKFDSKMVSTVTLNGKKKETRDYTDIKKMPQM